jgi:hypothetical protein
VASAVPFELKLEIARQTVFAEVGSEVAVDFCFDLIDICSSTWHPLDIKHNTITTTSSHHNHLQERHRHRIRESYTDNIIIDHTLSQDEVLTHHRQSPHARLAS